jgi:pimeloyl-ACP methyl ester carboxylesterase
MYELYTTDLRLAVSSIRTPVLLLVGTAGITPEARAAYLSSARRQVSNISDVDVRDVSSARHFIQLDDPDMFHRIMDEFLARVKR